MAHINIIMQENATFLSTLKIDNHNQELRNKTTAVTERKEDERKENYDFSGISNSSYIKKERLKPRLSSHPLLS